MYVMIILGNLPFNLRVAHDNEICLLHIKCVEFLGYVLWDEERSRGDRNFMDEIVVV